jgi:hypothetical protein
VNGEIVNQALEAMTTALSSSADGAAIKAIPSVRKSQSFSSGPAGRVLLHVDSEGAAVPAAGVPEPSTSTLRGPFRRVTPMGWFPRGQKKESYLERKIRMLQVEIFSGSCQISLSVFCCISEETLFLLHFSENLLLHFCRNPLVVFLVKPFCCISEETLLY